MRLHGWDQQYNNKNTIKTFAAQEPQKEHEPPAADPQPPTDKKWNAKWQNICKKRRHKNKKNKSKVKIFISPFLHIFYNFEFHFFSVEGCRSTAGGSCSFWNFWPANVLIVFLLSHPGCVSIFNNTIAYLSTNNCPLLDLCHYLFTFASVDHNVSSLLS